MCFPLGNSGRTGGGGEENNLAGVQTPGFNKQTKEDHKYGNNLLRFQNSLLKQVGVILNTDSFYLISQLWRL